MTLIEMFNQAGFLAKLTVLVGLVPLPFAVAYAARPAERRLALTRVVSLAAMFAGLSGLTVGLITVSRGIGVVQNPDMHRAYLGLSEALVPAFVNFGVLSVVWLLVAAGMMRRSE